MTRIHAYWLLPIEYLEYRGSIAVQILIGLIPVYRYIVCYKFLIGLIPVYRKRRTLKGLDLSW